MSSMHNSIAKAKIIASRSQCISKQFSSKILLLLPKTCHLLRASSLHKLQPEYSSQLLFFLSLTNLLLLFPISNEINKYALLRM